MIEFDQTTGRSHQNMLLALGYEIESLIAKGGLGCIYKVKDARSGKIFAAKLPYFDEDPSQEKLIRKAFRNEISLMLSLKPNSVEYGCLDINNVCAWWPFFVEADSSPPGNDVLLMEFIDGFSIDGLIKSKQLLTFPQTIVFAIQICKGMAWCQYKRPGFVHRDIKPSNIMVTRNKNGKAIVKIIDVGIARSFNYMTGLTKLGVGTLKYWPQEFRRQADGIPDVYHDCASWEDVLHKYGTQIDIYSFGISVVEMLSGEAPMGLDYYSKPQIYDYHFSSVPGTVANDFRMIIEKCLEADPCKRYESFKLIITDLLALNTKISHENILQCSDCGFYRYKSTTKCPVCKAISKEPPIYYDKRCTKVNFVKIFRGRYSKGCSEALAEELIRKYNLHPNEKKHFCRNTFYEACNMEYDFEISATAISNNQYLDFIRDTGHPIPNHWNSDKSPPFPLGEEDYPVTQVSWHDADAFCAWLGGRLPTDDEWERVARFTDGRLFPWGNEFDAQRCNGVELGRGNLVPVQYFEAGRSPEGVYNLVGNVWEWAWASKPRFASARGGSYADMCKMAGLAFFDQIAADADKKTPNIGFRIVVLKALIDRNGETKKNGAASHSLTLHYSKLPYHELQIIPSGYFHTGIPDWHVNELSQLAEKYGYDSNRFVKAFPYERHYLTAFCISKYPITNEEYLAFVRSTGHPYPSTWLEGKGVVAFPVHEARKPVTGVSTLDTMAFCAWLGHGTRLPTDLEWEKAARSEDGRLYPWGERFDPAQCYCVESRSHSIQAVDAASNTSSPYGVCGMVGNVWEWVLPNMSNRGGSFEYPCQLYGLGFIILDESVRNQSKDIGFRCVRG